VEGSEKTPLKIFCGTAEQVTYRLQMMMMMMIIIIIININKYLHADNSTAVYYKHSRYQAITAINIVKRKARKKSKRKKTFSQI
jgi:hypothetical protein